MKVFRATGKNSKEQTELKRGNQAQLIDTSENNQNEDVDYAESVLSSAVPESIDADALASVADGIGLGNKTVRPRIVMTRKDKRAAKREFKQALKEAKRQGRSAKSDIRKQTKAQKKKKKTIAQQLKERDKELSGRTGRQRAKRRRAKDVTDYIGYERMFKDGMCEVEEGLYSETIEFSDISYQSAREDAQKEVFSAMCGLLDYFGAETLIEYNVINTPILKEQIGNRKFFDPSKQDNADSARDAETFNDILNTKMREGVSNIRRLRYLTYSTAAPSPDYAVPLLSRMRIDASGMLTKIGCDVHKLDGKERLRVIHSQLRPDQPFMFDYDNDISLKTAQTTKDCIAPNVIDFKPDGECSYFTTEGKFGQVLVMRRFGSELCDRALSDIVNLPIALNATWYVQAMDKAKAIAFVKQRSAWIDKEIIEEQRSAVSKGYDFTILPAELNYSKEETTDVLDHLQNKNQRLFVFTGLIYTYADTKEDLDNQVIQIISTARRKSIDVETLDYRQREGLNSILPLGHNHVEVSRMFTTAQAGIFLPFATQELDQKGGNYYGQNKGSGNLVICNRKSLASPMGFVAGKTGSGKGMFVKNEMEGTILNNPTDQIIVIDRAGEYPLLCNHHHGTEIKFSVDSKTFMNPFDTTGVAHMSREAQIAFKVDAMLAQAAASAAESGQGLDEGDQSIITRAVELAYDYAQRERPNRIPLLEDFYRILKEQPEPQAKVIALRYERFVKGSMAFFNNYSNIDFDDRIIDINIKELPDSMLVFALINTCEAVRNQMYLNYDRGIRTWLYIEEIQSMFKYPTVLTYFSRFANEGRKFGLLLTGITQNSIAMLDNEAARNIVLNADFIMLLKQSPLDRKEWVSLLGLSVQEETCIDESVNPGDGLLVAGSARIPIIGNFPSGNELYDLFSTDPNEAAERKLREGFGRGTSDKQAHIKNETEHK